MEETKTSEIVREGSKCKVLPCKEPGCTNFYQDAIYGKGKRVHNLSQKGQNKDRYSCTVCGHVKL